MILSPRILSWIAASGWSRSQLKRGYVSIHRYNSSCLHRSALRYRSPGRFGSVLNSGSRYLNNRTESTLSYVDYNHMITLILTHSALNCIDDRSVIDWQD